MQSEVMRVPAAAGVGVDNLPHTVTGVARVDSHLVLLAAQVGQAAGQAAVLAAWLCTPHRSGQTLARVACLGRLDTVIYASGMKLSVSLGFVNGFTRKNHDCWFRLLKCKRQLQGVFLFLMKQIWQHT